MGEKECKRKTSIFIQASVNITPSSTIRDIYLPDFICFKCNLQGPFYFSSFDFRILAFLTLFCFYYYLFYCNKNHICGTVVKESACQCRRQEMRVWSLGWEDPLEKEMATHSSIPAWKIPRTEESGRLQSIGCKESDTTEELRTHELYSSMVHSPCYLSLTIIHFLNFSLF